MNKIQKIKNYAFIDGQNLYLGTKEVNFVIDFKKLRVYLRDKYKIEEAYYFLGFVKEKENTLYTQLQKAGFIIIFREHSELLAGNKKGNVDPDIIFEIMKKLLDESDDFEKVLIISGDGDYKKLVDYLIQKKRFLKILFPNKKFASSLYKKITWEYFDYLEKIKHKISYKKKVTKKKKEP
ncbi:MAG: NYN domain-containing protein [Candidatus Pacebacteria bacterium]|nr:NYN domain-containing protein [Candidatus Paceibacterota bacterium]